MKIPDSSRRRMLEDCFPRPIDHRGSFARKNGARSSTFIRYELVFFCCRNRRNMGHECAGKARRLVRRKGMATVRHATSTAINGKWAVVVDNWSELFIQEPDLARRARSTASNLSFLILRMNEPVNEFRVRSVYLFFLPSGHTLWGSRLKSRCRSILALSSERHMPRKRSEGFLGH